MKLMTTAEAAAYLQVHEMTMYRWMKRGIVPAVKIGGSWRVVVDELDKPLGVEGTKAPQQRR